VVSHVVSFSGGVGSWYAARRVAEQFGTADLHLLFADTKMEDEDLYRFLVEAAVNVGGTFLRIADGRTPWDVFHDRRFLGNSQVDLCSRILKRELFRSYLEQNFDPADTVVYLGLDWTEAHRFERAGRYWAPWTAKAPLCDPPYVDKDEIFREMSEVHGIRRPRLYDMGFPHNNCGGFCVKAGMGAFKLLLEKLPDRYREHEEHEEALRTHLGKDVAIMRSRAGGVARPVTMRAFRERIENDAAYQVDPTDLGGCGCFTPGEDEV
jgi:hypothetical protein